MSLPKQVQKIKGFLAFYEHNLLTGVHILLLLGVGMGGYLLGAENAPGEQETAIRVYAPSQEYSRSGADFRDSSGATSVLAKGRKEGTFVASLKGTKYHRLDCAGAKTIKEENRVFFATEEEAKSAGYTPAGNCPGLK